MKHGNMHLLQIATKRATYLMPPDDLEFIVTESAWARMQGRPHSLVTNGDGNLTHLFKLSGEAPLSLYKQLGEWEQTLQTWDQFVRVHQSYIVNIRHIRVIWNLPKGTKLELTSGRKVPVSDPIASEKNCREN